MKLEIEINPDSCKQCGYVDFKAIPFMNSFRGQWFCRLFETDLSTDSGGKAWLKDDIPSQCGECKVFVRRHLATPEFQG